MNQLGLQQQQLHQQQQQQQQQLQQQHQQHQQHQQQHYHHLQQHLLHQPPCQAHAWHQATSHQFGPPGQYLPPAAQPSYEWAEIRRLQDQPLAVSPGAGDLLRASSAGPIGVGSPAP